MEQLIENEFVVVISDLHVADPDINPEVKKKGLDDFDRDDDFARLLTEIIPDRTRGRPATLIINGDFIDFIQVFPEFGRHSVGDRFGVTEDRSSLKLKRVMEGHPLVFDKLGEFLKGGGQVLVLPGNHDIDLHWDDVFDDFRTRLGGVKEPQLRFVKSGVIEEQRIYIEHGNQYSYDNWFEYWTQPIRDAPDGRKRLERPWGTLLLDLVYNDIKDLYPFSNKIYPHAKLAWIALRSFKDDTNVSPKAIARLLLFFAGKGKRFLWEQLLGDSSKEVMGDSISVEEVWRRAEDQAGQARFEEVKAEIAALTGGSQETVARVPSSESALLGPVPGTLGRTESWGTAKKQFDLLERGDIDIVSFGHTHTAVDGNKNPPFGDRRRGFNTGSWVPNIPIGIKEKPRWKDLAAKSSVADLRYLLIKLKPYPVASLEPILPRL